MKLLLAFLGPELRANTYQKQYCPIQYSYNRLSCSISALTPENCRNDRKMDDFLDFSDSEDDSESETLFESWFDKESIPQAKKWDFDVFKFSKENSLFLVKFAGFVLAQSGLIEKYNIDKRNLFFFLKDVQLSYNEQVPYHNAVHATDILQAVYHALNKENGGLPLKERLTSDETLSLILAVIGHDIGHLGKTNIFLEKTKHEFYLDNPDSPNEAMHFRLFSEKIHKWKVLDQLPEDKQRQIIENIEVLILATNMDHHEVILREWQFISKHFDFNSIECRLALMKYVLKFCDVSNPARKQPLYNEWTLLLREEMHQEGDSMRLLGLSVDGTRDRSLPTTISKIQCWFIENRVQRYLKNIKDVGLSLDEPLQQVQINLKNWRQREIC